MNSEIFSIANIIDTYHLRIMEVCSKLPGTKTLVFTDEISDLLNKICEMSVLRKGSIENVMKIQNIIRDKCGQRVLFMIPSDKENISKVTDFIKYDKENNLKRNYVIAFVPFLSEAGRYYLYKEDLPFEHIGIFDLKVGWIPLDNDLLTGDCPYLYPSAFMNQNTTECYHFGQMVADALLVGLERPTFTCKIYVLGEQSKWSFRGLYDDCNKTSDNYKSSDSKTGSTHVYILSRDLDYITPFCIPITFEALIHEVIGLKYDCMTLTTEMTNENSEKTVTLNSTNSVFQETRLLPLTQVGSKIIKRSKELDDVKNSIDVLKRPDQLKDFMTKNLKSAIKEKNEISQCFYAYQYILDETTSRDRVDDVISAQASLLLGTEEIEFPRAIIVEYLTCKSASKHLEALRLLCLWTATHDGIANTMYTELSRLLCHSLGYPIIPLLHNLRKLKLLAPKLDFQQFAAPISTQMGTGDSTSGLSSSASANNLNMVRNIMMAPKSRYYNLRTYLNLFSNQQMSSSVDCLHKSYIFAGHHTPICTALIDEISLKSGSSHLNRNLTPNPSMNDLKNRRQPVSPLDEAMKNLNVTPDALKNYGRTALGSGTSARQGKVDLLIVCFVGGCTYAEITSLRQLAVENNLKLIILTSCVLNNKDLIMQSRLAD